LGKVADFFQFSTAQLRFVLVLSGTAVIMTTFLLIRALSRPTPEAVSFPVFLADDDREFSGLFVLDPNTAPPDSLELLPGIGKVLADRIVEHRQQHRFERAVDLTEINGIGPKLFEQLRPYIRITPL
jgi:predicted flap endonuclease-1-like 5' DNA nuclease